MKKLLSAALILLIITAGAATYAQVYPLPSNNIYTYEQLSARLQKFASDHPDIITLSVAGKSVDNRNLWSITLGTGEKNILITGALHAREWLTAPVLVEMISFYIREYNNGGNIKGEPVKHILDQYSITFIPMVNPDGVTLAQKGADIFPNRQAALLKMNAPGWDSDFRNWKANIRGVDLNRNYNAAWDDAKAEIVSNVPSYAFYKGPSPESEPETKTVADWVRANKPELILDFHSSGEYIYWYYNQKGSALDRDKAIAESLAAASGYRLEPINTSKPANTTLQRWGSSVMKTTSICVEIGNKPSPNLTMNDLSANFKKVRYLPLAGVLELPGFVPYVPTLSVNVPASLQMVIDESEILTASIFPLDASNKTLIWTSNNPEVVSVGEDGMLSANSAGSAYITAATETGNRQASCFVTVYASPDEVEDTEPPLPSIVTSDSLAVNPDSLIISKITAGMTAEDFLAGINESNFARIYSGKTEVSGKTLTATGHVMKIMDENLAVRTYPIIVTGDTNGDGIISVTDMLMIKGHLLGTSSLKGEALYAADTNGDKNVSITDFIQIKSHILGKESVIAREH